MALIQCEFYSQVLGLSTTMNVIIPQGPGAASAALREGGKATYPVLYLLHGLSDNYSVWHRRTSIERYAEAAGLAVVMPEVHRSFYTDMGKHRRYWTFISEELPAVAESLFPIATTREARFVAGLSMGGYGAYKLALRNPDRFAAAASLSGALDIGTIEAFMNDEMQVLFGEQSPVGTDNDLFWLAEQQARTNGQKPALYQCCGTEDFLYADNLKFLSHARKLNLAVDYEEEPGAHTWDYWDMKIQRVLQWLPLPQRTIGGNDR